MNGEWLPLDCSPAEDGTVRVRGDRAVILTGVDLIEMRRLRPVPLYRLHRPSEGCPHKRTATPSAELAGLGITAGQGDFGAIAKRTGAK
ncbi:hypothetical protein [Nocardia sp. NPDC057272]|uniref:hypothetical protein n=1 Tax=Nocardia sp. NPDC057272 TaxID=3346079 RepID=UPI00362A6EE2